MWLRYITSDSTGDERLAAARHAAQEGVGRRSTASSPSAPTGAASSSSTCRGQLRPRCPTRRARSPSPSIAADGTSAGDWRLDDPDAWRPALSLRRLTAVSPVQLDAGPDGLALQHRAASRRCVRLTTTDMPVAPPIVATETTDLDLVDGYGGGHRQRGLRARRRAPRWSSPARAEALPMVGNNGGLSDLTAALREYGDQATNIPITDLLVARGHARSRCSTRCARQGVGLTDSADRGRGARRAALGRLLARLAGLPAGRRAHPRARRSSACSRWRSCSCAGASYEVAALRVVGVRRRDLRRAIVTEYVALLGMAVVGGALAAVAVAAARAAVARHRRDRDVRPRRRLQPALAGDGRRARPS